jgi:hypothetical protein
MAVVRPLDHPTPPERESHKYSSPGKLKKTLYVGGKQARACLRPAIHCVLLPPVVSSQSRPVLPQLGFLSSIKDIEKEFYLYSELGGVVH